MSKSLFGETDTRSGAEFSPCRRYRYALWRIWDADKPLCGFVGLNPSTADETADDPTIRRCIGFAKSWGYGGLVMLNAFGFRSTFPEGLRAAQNPRGPGWYRLTGRWADRCELLVAAWGSSYLPDTARANVCELGRELHCLGLTKDGHPRHPLYLKATTPLQHYWSPDD